PPLGARVAQGRVSGAPIPSAIPCELPGRGSVSIGQEPRFLRPVRLGDDSRIELEILEKLAKNRVRIATRVVNQEGKKVVDGTATVMAPTDKVKIDRPTLPPVTC